MAFAIPLNLKEVRSVERIRSHHLFLSVLRLRPATAKNDAR